MKKKQRRLPPEINAGSMADIAFLLLVFFLVATTVVVDKGILVRLPPWVIDAPPPAPVPPRNLLPVNINSEGKLLVENKETALADFKEIVKEFITNPNKSPDLPSSPKKAVVSLRNDRGTPYATYISVYDQLKAAYNEVWNETAQKQYHKAYTDITISQQREIRSQWPQIISEAELTAFGE